jgi:hypothetical protein
MYGVSDVLTVLLAAVFITGIALLLAVITRKDEVLEHEQRANTVRAQLLLLSAVALGVLALLVQRYELAASVKHLLH